MRIAAAHTDAAIWVLTIIAGHGHSVHCATGHCKLKCDSVELETTKPLSTASKMSPAKYVTLRVLEENTSGLSLAVLSELLGWSTARTAYQLRRSKECGLVRRLDGTPPIWMIMPKGIAKLNYFRGQGWTDEIFNEVDPSYSGV